MKVAIIGGGAAGYFAAISCKSHFPDAIVTIFEKTDKVLSKVKISGGGRCNVTNACESLSDFLKHYPRGQKPLKKTFHQFNRIHTIQWFAERGVVLKSEEDGRMFPTTNNSQTIIDCFEKELSSLEITLLKKHAVDKIECNQDRSFNLNHNDSVDQFDHIIVTTGGSPKSRSYHWLEQLGHTIIEPVPSLFTFNIYGSSALKKLMGLAVPIAEVKIRGSKLSQKGPLLITHWGLSGPAVLKLSAWGARLLAEMGYEFEIAVNWCGASNEEELRSMIEHNLSSYSKKKLSNGNFFTIPNRLWQYFLNRLEIDDQMIWSDVKKKDKNRIINALCNDTYQVKGKTTFKEEFVTSGGVTLSEVDFNTMESRLIPNLYFAGEVLNIDGVTGGFNFQAAWSTAHVAGKLSSPIQ
jgi:predicted Rossmann fold flavoprotein